jgi:hypothetical protein
MSVGSSTDEILLVQSQQSPCASSAPPDPVREFRGVRPLSQIPDNSKKLRYAVETKMTPAAKKPPVRMGDVAQLAARTERMDGLEIRMSRVESKIDRLIEIVLDLRPKSVPKR